MQTKMNVLFLCFLFLTSCKQVVETTVRKAAAIVADPVTTYTCSDLDQFSTQALCEIGDGLNVPLTGTQAHCVSDSQYYPDGTVSHCFKPVAGWENCVSNSVAVAPATEPVTHWLYTPYGNPVFSTIFSEYRSLVGCSSAICLCDSSLLPGDLYIDYTAGTAFSFAAGADYTKQDPAAGHVTTVAGGVAQFAGASSGYSVVNNLTVSTYSDSLHGFAETIDPVLGCPKGVKYQLSCNTASGANAWLYWDNTAGLYGTGAWVSAGSDVTSLDPVLKANSAYEVNEHIADATFLVITNDTSGRGPCVANTIYWRAFLQSDGSSVPCSLDAVNILTY